MNRDISRIPLVRSGHPPGEGMTIMEMVAYVCGEPLTNEPACGSPVLSAWMKAWADSLGPDERPHLRRYVSHLAVSRGGAEIEARRQWLVVDWLVRTATPSWLRFSGLAVRADALAALPEIASHAGLGLAQGTVEAAAAAAHEVNAAAWSGIARHPGSAARHWEVVVGAALRTVETAMAVIEPAAFATGYSSVPQADLPSAWSAAIAAISNAGVTIGWNAVGLLIERASSWLASAPDDEIWPEVQRVVTAALDPPVKATTNTSHQLVVRMLGIEDPYRR